MSLIDDLKNKANLGSGDRTFLNRYEQPIRDLLDKIDKDSKLKKGNDLTKDNFERFVNLRASSDVAYELYNNLNKIFAHYENDEIDANIKIVNECGLGLNFDRSQYISLLCHMYQVDLERLRLQLLTFIDFNSDPLNVGSNSPSLASLIVTTHPLRSYYG